MMSRVAKALFRHPSCSVLPLSFGIMMSFVGNHDSKRQVQKTIDVFIPAMSICAFLYGLDCILFTRRQLHRGDENTSKQWPLQ